MYSPSRESKGTLIAELEAQLQVLNDKIEKEKDILREQFHNIVEEEILAPFMAFKERKLQEEAEDKAEKQVDNSENSENSENPEATEPVSEDAASPEEDIEAELQAEKARMYEQTMNQTLDKQEIITSLNAGKRYFYLKFNF